MEVIMWSQVIYFYISYLNELPNYNNKKSHNTFEYVRSLFVCVFLL